MTSDANGSTGMAGAIGHTARYIAAMIAALSLALTACGGGGSSSSATYTAAPSVAQKGPLVAGSVVTAQELDDNLSPVGSPYTWTVTSNLGNFTPTTTFQHRYISLTATGQYFDETTNTTSTGTVTLNGIYDLASGSQVNLNVMTTLAYARIKDLVTNAHLTVAAAQHQAETEVLTALNIPGVVHVGEFRNLDLSHAGNDNLILATVSGLFVQGHSATQLATLISDFRNDIADNGAVDSATTRAAISNATLTLNTANLANNLNGLYGTSGATMVANDLAAWAGQIRRESTSVFSFDMTNAGPYSAVVLPAAVVNVLAGRTVSANNGVLRVNNVVVVSATLAAGDQVSLGLDGEILPVPYWRFVDLNEGDNMLARVAFVMQQPQDPAQYVTGYFYAGSVVKGLLYGCATSGITLSFGNTDDEGRFVCQRNTVASFYVGKAGMTTLKLGEIDLRIYGSAGDTLARNNVIVTPSTLYGTTADGTRREVANIYNLLATLDAREYGFPVLRPTIYLPVELNDYLVQQSSFLALINGGLDVLPSLFASRLTTLANTVNPVVPLERSLAMPSTPALSGDEAIALANGATLKSRAGVYKVAPKSLLSVDSLFQMTGEFVVDDEGRVDGFLRTFRAQAPASGGNVYTNLLSANSTATVQTNGLLQNFTFSNNAGDQIDLLGKFVNDIVWGGTRLCQAGSPNATVPQSYCQSAASAGGYDALNDAGHFSSALTSPSTTNSGELFIYPVAQNPPDIALEFLPYTLPQTYEMTLSRYTDVHATDFYSTDHDDVNEDKAVFGAPADLPQKLRYTILPDGAIVSDVNADCSTVTYSSGQYHDAHGTQEYLLGHAGNIFIADVDGTPYYPVDDKAFITFYIASLNPGEPHNGLFLGLSAIGRTGLAPLVIQADTGEIFSKSCDATALATCTDRVEWFNDVTFLRDVYAPIATTPSMPQSQKDTLFRDNTYYGQVKNNAFATCPP